MECRFCGSDSLISDIAVHPADLQGRLPAEEDLRAVRGSSGATLRVATELPRDGLRVEELCRIHAHSDIHYQLSG